MSVLTQDDNVRTLYQFHRNNVIPEIFNQGSPIKAFGDDLHNGTSTALILLCGGFEAKKVRECLIERFYEGARGINDTFGRNAVPINGAVQLEKNERRVKSFQA